MNATIDRAIEIATAQRQTAELMARKCRDAAEHTDGDAAEFIGVARRAVNTIETTIDMLVDAGAIYMEDDSGGQLRDNLTRARAALDRARECRDAADDDLTATDDYRACDCGRDRYEPHAHDCAIR